jgi:hypothetical protein
MSGSTFGKSDNSDDLSDMECRFTNFTDQVKPGATDVEVEMIGRWWPSRSLGGVGGQQEVEDNTLLFNETSLLTIRLPEAVSDFSLWGTVGYNYGIYRIAIDPAPPLQYSREIFNATRFYTSPNQLLYTIPLDPALSYTVYITGDPDRSKLLGLSSYRVCFFNPS